MPMAWRWPASKAIPWRPLTMFKAIRTRMDELGLGSDCRIIRTRAEIPGLVAAHES
jgi:2-haloacid dehalogenase